MIGFIVDIIRSNARPARRARATARSMRTVRTACARAQTVAELAAVSWSTRTRYGAKHPAARYAERYTAAARYYGWFDASGIRRPGRPGGRRSDGAVPGMR